MSNIEKYNENIFESIKHIDQNGNEYWYARELSKVLKYRDWRNFQKVVDKAIISVKNSVSDNGGWVVGVNKPIKTGKGKEELLQEYYLLPEDDKRLKSRIEIRTGNRTLSRTAINAGVKNLDKFHNAGYKGGYITVKLQMI